MKNLIFSNYGCEIYEENDRYYIYYDSGESSGSRMIKKEILYKDIEKIKKSEKDAYEVILSLQ